MKAPKFITVIDFTTLRSQKTTLLKVIDQLELDGKESEADDLEGILALIDALQDFAVDELHVPEMHVFDFELEESRDGKPIPETPEEEFARVNAEIIYQMRIEGEGLYIDDEMPKEFIEGIVENRMYATIIKDMIRRDILNDVTLNPDNFDRDTNGKLTYDATMSDYGFAIEEYCRERFKEEINVPTGIKDGNGNMINEGDTLPVNYFEIVHSGFQKDLGREEIQVHAGKNGNIFLIKTDEGLVVDVYGQNDLVDTLAIFEDDLDN